jgi:Protein of unknown function (DUF559)
MADVSTALQATASSQVEDGLPLASWVLVRSLSARKPCAFCGREFTPYKTRDKFGEVRTRKNGMNETVWNRQQCCGQSCAKKFKNPMSKNQARLKMIARLREIRHKPIKRGGNGQLLPLAQLALLHALGEGWESEVAVATKMARDSGYPTCYKFDIGNREKRIGIEVDGNSHQVSTRRTQDAKKMLFMTSLGWSVYRVSNKTALHLYSTFVSADILLTSLMEGSFTTAT